MNILMVSSYLPYPLYSGGSVRLYNLIKELSRNHKITLVCEIRDYQTAADVKGVEKLCQEVITFPRKKQWTMQNILKTGYSKYPFLLTGHTLPEMKKTIVKLLNEKHFDVIHIETFYVFQNLPKTYLPTVLIEHNVEYLVYERYANIAKFYLRPFLGIDIQKIKYWEEKFWKRATKLVAVSEKEKQIMKRSDTVVVPNGVDIKNFKFQISPLKFKKREKKILFIGDFKWIQNKQALDLILKKIWPLVKSKIKDPSFTKVSAGQQKSKITLWVVGKNIPENLKSIGDESVFFDENAPDETWKIYHQSYVLLAPITVGGGTSYKILESMATGLPVVTTQLGVEGIGAKDKSEALIGEDPAELADHVVTLLQESELYEKIAKQARALIEEKYSWEKIAKVLESVYKKSMQERL